MPASACLRIVLDLSEEKLARLDALGPLVARVTGAFLETRWSWPKHHATLNPFCFMLTDPRATELDVTHLRRLADELQIKLFGASEAGDVTLLLLDGNQADIALFVELDHAAIKAATREPLRPTPFGGRLLKISTAADAGSNLQWRALEHDSATTASRFAGRHGRGELETSFRGVYFSPHQTFVGSGVSANPTSASHYSLVDGVERLPHDREEAFDLACLQAARLYLQRQSFTGVMFVPVCFSSLMRRSARQLYDQEFRDLPADRRQQLAAVVYDAPRSPAFHVFGEIQNLLGPHFSIVDLQVADAGFDVDSVPPGGVNSVTFRLPSGDERSRLAAMRRFMDRRDAFKRRKIWPAITNVRTHVELEGCLGERVPFVSGLAVCGSVDGFVGGLPWDADQLPLTRAA